MLDLLGLQLSKFYRSQRLKQALKVVLGLIICLGTILRPAAIARVAGDLSRQPVTEITVIATAKTVRTFLIAETIAITGSSFFLLPSSFFLLLYFR